MKNCKSCDQEKEKDQFGKRAASPDGLSSKCKVCQKVYDKARSKDPFREEQRRVYAQSAEGKLTGNKAKSEYRKRNPKKSRAHSKVSRSVRNGDLKMLPCAVCGIEETVAHHDDYDYPLSVRWLCHAHHSQWHAENGEGLNAH